MGGKPWKTLSNIWKQSYAKRHPKMKLALGSKF